MTLTSLKAKVESTVDEMESEGNLEREMTSDWATPVVMVVFAFATIIKTLNKNLKVGHYPLPRREECFHATEREKMSKLDFR